MPKQPFKLEKNHKPMKTQGEANGEVKTYFLQGEELEKYRRMPPDFDPFEKKKGRPHGGGAA